LDAPLLSKSNKDVQKNYTENGMRELTVAEAQYVDQMVGTIISGMIAKNPNSYNTDYFKMLGQTAYQLALVMLDVKTEKVTVVETTLAQAVDNAIEVVKDITEKNFSPDTAPSVLVPSEDETTGGPILAKTIIKAIDDTVKAKKKTGRPKGSKTKRKAATNIFMIHLVVSFQHSTHK